MHRRWAFGNVSGDNKMHSKKKIDKRSWTSRRRNWPTMTLPYSYRSSQKRRREEKM